MSLFAWIRQHVMREEKARDLGEQDAPGDARTARTRETGGVPDVDARDQHSTTGTTPNETFVGRVSGDEAGDAGMSGAEGRAEQDRREQRGSGSD